MKLLAVLILFTPLTIVASPQNADPPTARLSFDVASLKASAPADGGPFIVRGGIPQRGGGWIATNATLDDMIRAAYPRHDVADQLTGGPAWIRSEKYDVRAKGPDNATPDQLAEMARHLLADRF